VREAEYRINRPRLVNALRVRGGVVIFFRYPGINVIISNRVVL